MPRRRHRIRDDQRQTLERVQQAEQRAAWYANALAFGGLALVVVAVYLIAEFLELGVGTLNVLFALLAVLIPLVSWYGLERIQTWLWVRSIAPDLRRLRALHFLSERYEEISREELANLDRDQQERLAALVEREQTGRKLSNLEYGQGLRLLLRAEREAAAQA